MRWLDFPVCISSISMELYALMKTAYKTLFTLCTRCRLLQQKDYTKKPGNLIPGSKRAIDGARTRGLDLGKVARYQLRHYRTSG